MTYTTFHWSSSLLAFLYLSLPAIALAAGGGGGSSAGSATAKPIKFLEPLPGGLTEISSACAGNPFSLLNTYLNPVMTWGIGVAAGISVLMVIIGGFQIILSGGDQSAIQNGKDRIKSALFGLLLLVISGTFLSLLNAYFFKLNPGAPPTC